MPTVDKAALSSQLSQRLRSELGKADTDGDGFLDPGQLDNLPTDLRAQAKGVADYIQQDLPTDWYQDIWDDYITRSLDSADYNGDGKLTDGEQGYLSQDVYDNVLALRASQVAPAPQPSQPNPPAPAPANGGQGASAIVGQLGPADITKRVLLANGLNRPTGVAYNPRDGVLWVVNRGDDTSVTVENPGKANQRAKKHYDDSAHFMNNPMQIAFSRSRNEFATVQDTANDYNGGAHANHFMGPTLWTADLDIFEGGTNSHLDMLHHSPSSVGIAAGKKPNNPADDKREYWVFNGESGSIDRYFFFEPHALGADDHSDGITIRYGAGALKAVAGIPGHLALDEATNTLYIADTGNGRIAKLDAGVTTQGSYQIQAHHGETPLYANNNGVVRSVTAPGALQRPSGLVVHEGKLIVSDYATGYVKVFSTAGQLLGELDTGLGGNSITGLAIDAEGRLIVANSGGNQVVEITVK